MNRRHSRPRLIPLDGFTLLLFATLFAVLSLVSKPASAQSGAGATDQATPASETQHTTEEEPTEPSTEGPTLPPAQEAVALKVFNELISPCCWTTTVAQHGSGAAPRIQAEVRQMLASGMKHQAILDHYVEEYGERILASPKKKGFNLAVYIVPPVALAAGVFLIAAAARRKGKITPPAAQVGSPRNGAAQPAASAGATARPAPGSEDDYRRRIQEEIRRSS